MFRQLSQKRPPAHYADKYVNYEGINQLVRQLLSILRSLKYREPFSPHVSPKLVEQSLKRVHSLQAIPQIDKVPTYLMITQSVFRDILQEEISKVNHFTAVKYTSIQEGIRTVVRQLRNKVELDMREERGCSHNIKSTGKTGAGSPNVLDSSRNGKGTITRTNSMESKSKSCQQKNGPGDANHVALEPVRLLPENYNLDSVDYENDSKQKRSYCSSDISESEGSQYATQEAEQRNLFLQECERQLNIQSAELQHLDYFIRVNYKAIMHLAHTFDQMAQSNIAPWISSSLSHELFANVDIDRLMIFMSVGWNKFRAYQKRDYKTARASKWIPPETFTRRTTKYWISLDNVIKLKLMILRHMPYLIFGESMEELEAYVDPYVRAAESTRLHKVEEGQMVTSVYFDSIDGYSYGRRILRLEGAELIRFRWYGQNHCELNKPIFIEKKTHHESWTGVTSTKDRFTMPQKHVTKFMTNQTPFEVLAKEISTEAKLNNNSAKYKNMLALGCEIQHLIEDVKLQPVIRTCYQRAAFQLTTSNEVRFSIDTNLCMVDEYSSSFLPKHGYWCRLGQEILGKDEIIRFPYAILEVKLQTSQQPEWVDEILIASEAIMMQKFSKFQHGLALLHPEITSHHIFPYWLPDFCKLHLDSHEEALDLQSPNQDSKMESRGPSAYMSYFESLRKQAVNFIYQVFSYPEEDLLSDFRNCEHNYMYHNVESLNFRTQLTELARDQESPEVPRHQSVDDSILSWSRGTKTSNVDVSRNFQGRALRKLGPKTHFACERVFLLSLNKAIYLSALGIALCALKTPSQTHRTAGALIGVFSVFVMIVSYFIFQDRSARIKKREMGGVSSDDADILTSYYNPILISVSLLLGIVVAGWSGIVTHHKAFVTATVVFLFSH